MIIHVCDFCQKTYFFKGSSTKISYIRGICPDCQEELFFEEKSYFGRPVIH
ncbi:hypothetical protein HDG70_001105 [Carboxydothermus ferrireducens DSM 11255]|uniref:Uncharacterized protein n=1 Tax=Carboxydothermus ferrireducens DSM 11255 TaxID=1119529 RepID=A0ABX2R8L1_9THEO|nr:hypothetical protein [Carboxydothermus ferrireducens DSM 11255]